LPASLPRWGTKADNSRAAAFVLALLLAWITVRTDVIVAALIPFITAPPIGAVAPSLLAAPRSGVINVFAGTLDATVPVLSIYTLGGLMLAMSLRARHDEGGHLAHEREAGSRVADLRASVACSLV
jgi:hypothetical protein